MQNFGILDDVAYKRDFSLQIRVSTLGLQGLKRSKYVFWIQI